MDYFSTSLSDFFFILEVKLVSNSKRGVNVDFPTTRQGVHILENRLPPPYCYTTTLLDNKPHLTRSVEYLLDICTSSIGRVVQ